MFVCFFLSFLFVCFFSLIFVCSPSSIGDVYQWEDGGNYVGRPITLTLTQLRMLKDVSIDPERELLAVHNFPKKSQSGEIIRALNNIVPLQEDEKDLKICQEERNDLLLLVNLDVLATVNYYVCLAIFFLCLFLLSGFVSFESGASLSNTLGLSFLGVLHSRSSRSKLVLWEGCIRNPFLRTGEERRLLHLASICVVSCGISLCFLMIGWYMFYKSSRHAIEFGIGIVEEVVGISFGVQCWMCRCRIPSKILRASFLSAVNTLFGLMAVVVLWVTVLCYHYDNYIGFESLQIENWLYLGLVQITCCVILTCALGKAAEVYRHRVLYRVYTLLVTACLVITGWVGWILWSEYDSVSGLVDAVCPDLLSMVHRKYFISYLSCDKYSEIGEDLLCPEPELRVDVWETSEFVSPYYNMACSQTECCTVLFDRFTDYVEVIQLGTTYLLSIILMTWMSSLQKSLEPSDRSYSRQKIIREKMAVGIHNISMITLANLGKVSSKERVEEKHTEIDPFSDDAALRTPQTFAEKTVGSMRKAFVGVGIMSTLWMPWAIDKFANSVPPPENNKGDHESSLLPPEMNGSLWHENASLFQDHHDLTFCVNYTCSTCPTDLYTPQQGQYYSK